MNVVWANPGVPESHMISMSRDPVYGVDDDQFKQVTIGIHKYYIPTWLEAVDEEELIRDLKDIQDPKEIKTTVVLGAYKIMATQYDVFFSLNKGIGVHWLHATMQR